MNGSELLMGDEPQQITPTTVESVSFSCSSSNRLDCFSFNIYLYRNSVFFDCWYPSAKKDIRFSSKMIGQSDLDQVNKIVSSYTLKDAHKSIKTLFFGGTSYKLNISWTDGSNKDVDIGKDGQERLKKFFVNKAIALQQERM